MFCKLPVYTTPICLARPQKMHVGLVLLHFNGQNKHLVELLVGSQHTGEAFPGRYRTGTILQVW